MHILWIYLKDKLFFLIFILKIEIKMEKLKILAISNREDYICYTLDKSKFYYNFLMNLLKEFNVKQIPDFYDGETGQLPNIIKITDSHYSFEDDIISLIHIIGHKKIFLFVKTKLRNKLNKFMESNCKFVQTKPVD